MTSILIDPASAEDALPLQSTKIGDSRVVWDFGDYAAEYQALRHGAGAIDCSAGGPIRVSGEGRLETLQRALTRDVEFLIAERTRMSLMLQDDGVPVDVVTVVACESEYLVLTGPGQAGLVEQALRAASAPATQIENRQAQTAVLAVEGPRAGRVVADVLGAECAALAYEASLVVEVEDVEVIVTRVGVTGEYGFTFVLELAAGALLWRHLVGAGAVPVGHRARETAMFELRQPIVHRELIPGDTVATAGLGWLVDPTKDDFVGRSAALAGAEDAQAPRPIGFLASGRPPLAGDELFVGSERVGHVVFVVDSPGAGGVIGLAKVEQEWQASRLELSTADGESVQTLAPPYVVPRSWSGPITAG